MKLEDILAAALTASPKLAKHAPVIGAGLIIGRAVVKAVKKRKAR